MKSKEELLEELNRFWDSMPETAPAFLSPESDEHDGAEIIQYFECIVNSAFDRQKIDEEQLQVCNISLNRLTEILGHRSRLAQVKAVMMQLSPGQILQSFLSFSEMDARGLQVLAEQSERQYIELNATGKAGPVYFLYAPLTGHDTFYDRYIESALPVNGDAEFCCYDNYLPVYKLMEKYFPDVVIRLVTDRSQVAGKYIYVVTFKYFPGFAEASGENLLAVVPGSVLEDCRNSKAILVYNDLAESTFYPSFNDKIQKQLAGNGIEKAFYLLSGDWANAHPEKELSVLQKLINFFQSKVEQPAIYVFNYFEEAMALSKKMQYPEYSYAVRLADLNRNKDVLRHFICLNRVVKDYRLYLSYTFYRNNLLERSFITQDSYTGEQDFRFGHHTNKALHDIMAGEQFERFRQTLPWRLDFDEVKKYDWDTVPMDAMNQSFCWVVTETAFSDTLPSQSFRLTEKTYKPIAFFMPFIMVGNPFILKKLREAGYQTFSRWWDEDYDSEVDPIVRMEKIVDLILKVSNLSKERLITMYEDMEPVLSHNYALLMKTNSGAAAMKILYQACNDQNNGPDKN